MNQSWPEHPALSRQSSLACYPAVRQQLQHSMSLDYGHHSPPLHHPHIHPAPNAHSSPRSSQRSRMARYSLSRSPAPSFDEQDDSSLGYGTEGPNSTSSLLLRNGSMDRELLTTVEGQNLSQLPQMQPPLLPEKKRTSDGEHSLGTASPSLSGFSSPHSGSSLSIPFPNVLPDLSAQMSGTASPLPGKLEKSSSVAHGLIIANTNEHSLNLIPLTMFSRCTGQQAGDCKICAGHIKILVQARYLEGSR